MIRISKENFFKDNFVQDHKINVRNFVNSKKMGISFFNHSFSYKEISSGELINHIAFDPFSLSGLNLKNKSFLKDYYEISNFLLYGSDYFNIVKEQIEKKSGSDYKKTLLDERRCIVNKFINNNILISLGINNSDIIRTEKNFLAFQKKTKEEFKKNNKNIESIFDYNDFLLSSRNIRNNILENIKITICPYCNRQYIDTYTHNGKIKSIAQIDHLFPKSIFPLYSLSLLNFVPSCSHCNCIIKRDRLFPWVSIYTDDPLDHKYFEVIYNNFNGLYGDIDGFKLKTNPEKKEDVNNACFFKHKELYENNIEDISSTLKKRLVFTSGYRKSLESILSKKITESEFRFIVFGVTGSADDYLKIPLSKLKNDILKS